MAPTCARDGPECASGGITIGGAITQRPDLFGAALIRVGDSDSLRSGLMASGPANIPEFGTLKEPDGFKALYAMDAYQHVKPNTAFPARRAAGSLLSEWLARSPSSRVNARRSLHLPPPVSERTRSRRNENL